MRWASQLLGKLRPYNGVKTPTIMQLSATECGVASLAMMFAYYHVHQPIESLREKCGTSRDGVNAATLMKIAHEYGFKVNAYKFDVDAIKQLTRPVIAFWKFSHYVVILGAGNERVFINDPAHGEMSVSDEEFDQCFTGVVIDILATNDVVAVAKKPLFGPLIKEWCNKYKYELFFILVCMFLVIAGPLLNSALSTVLVDYLIIAGYVNWAPYLAIIVTLSAIVFTSSLRLQQLTQFRLTAKVSITKSSALFLHMLRLPLLFYALRQKPEISTILMRAETVANVLYKNITSSVISLSASLICCFCLMKIDAMLAIVFLASSLAVFIPLMMLSKLNYSYEQTSVNALGKFYGMTLSSMRNIETIKTCGIEQSILAKWYATLCEKTQSQDKANLLSVVIDAIHQSFHSFAMLITLCIGGYRVADGDMSVGSLMAFYALQLYLSGQTVNVLLAFKSIQTAYVSHIRMNDLEQHDMDSRFQSAESMSEEATAVAVSCSRVSFSYNKNISPTLRDINLNVMSGEHIALVGGTGSGKSTVAKLLSSLYAPTEGEISIFGRRSNTLNADELSRLCAFVSQDVTLFTGTLYENLTLACADVPQNVLEAAIHDACLDDLVKDRGIDAMVSECGSNFSGGERQRIDIARALIQGTKILILDEATSSLDVALEERIITNLKRRALTIIFVAHRLSTIMHCNQIYVMHDGCVVERGNHSSLLGQRGQYCQLVQAQGGA